MAVAVEPRIANNYYIRLKEEEEEQR